MTPALSIDFKQHYLLYLATKFAYIWMLIFLILYQFGAVMVNVKSTIYNGSPLIFKTIANYLGQLYKLVIS